MNPNQPPPASRIERSSMQGRFDLIFRMAGAALVVVGIYLVLQPFVSALLVAGVLAIATWPAYEKLRRNLRGNSTVSASVMLLLILVTVIVPIALLAEAAADHLPALFSTLRDWRAEDLRVPEQIRSLPIIGESVYQSLTSLVADRTQSAALLQRALQPAGKLSLAFVRLLGDGLLQMLLVTFIVFFYYRDGERIAQLTHRVSHRLSGEMSNEVLSIVVGTTRSVFISIVGTAAAQAIVAYIGFLIAGVPGAFLLSVGTFILSVVPMGPVVLWGGAAIWLYLQGRDRLGDLHVDLGRRHHQQHRQLCKAAVDRARLDLVAGPYLSRRNRGRTGVWIHRRHPGTSIARTWRVIRPGMDHHTEQRGPRSHRRHRNCGRCRRGAIGKRGGHEKSVIADR